ncbi:hypothetical protein FB451DRAFT_240829 [Mycena latifolia]|nr:hypothetical protein FB451DRAFT_240829 [Mycena latifolia]
MAPDPPQSPLSTAEYVKGLIDATKANILRIESHINDLTLTLQKERSKLARLWLMTTPMGKLPTELLVEIFTHSVEDDAISSESIQIDEVLIVANGPRSPTHQLLLLSQVCPHWRRIVNNTPKLWATGVVDVRLDKKSCNTEPYITGLKTLLERSAPFPISVSLTQEGTTGTSTEAVAQAAATSTVIRAMAPTIRRWKSFKVDCLSFKPLTVLPGGSFPTLEALEMQYDTYGQTDPIRAFFPAPRLRRLALLLSGPGGASPDRFLLLPWNQLIHLKLEHQSLAGCSEILTQCSNLVSADLITTEWNFRHAVSASATILPFLETLKVRFDMGDDEIGRVDLFFVPLSLPTLHSLHLTFDPTPGVLWPMHEFSAFQRRSPNIAHIALTNCPITSGELIILLRHAPAVTALILKDSFRCVDDELLQLLTYDDNDDAPPLAPQLRQLRCEAVGYVFSEGALEAAIRSRWWTQEGAIAAPPRVARLQKVTVSRDSDSMSGDLIYRMQDLVEQGLDLNLSGEY